ncbi:hypothetical protein ID866_8991 [Astraeus odoratus]|nr:hypothetical protein ID866_8991 [Astraeus odoratus]
MLSQVLVQPPPLLALGQQEHHHNHLHHHHVLDDAPTAPACPRLSVVDDHLFATLEKSHTVSAPSGTPDSPLYAGSVHQEASPDSAYSAIPDSRQAEEASPSPVEVCGGTFPLEFGHQHHPHQFSDSASSYGGAPDLDSYRMANVTMERHLRGSDKYSHASHHPLLDQRRMSEPAVYSSATGTYPTHPSSDLAADRYHHPFHNNISYASPRSYPSSGHRTSSLGSPSCNKLSRSAFDPQTDLDYPLSPFNPSFSGGAPSPSMGLPDIPNLHEDYGSSPPGTGTSSSSNALATRHYPQLDGGSNSPPSSKQYSFVSLPGNAVKKRPRRRYDEIERLYQCSWPNCTKAYGTLNHLNAHVTMQKHGSKRSPNEFKELRKQWRKAKKEEAEARALNAMNMRQAPQHHPQRHLSRESLSDAEYSSYHLASRHMGPGLHPDLFAPQPGSSGELHDAHGYNRELYPRRQHRYDGYVPPSTASSGAAYTPGIHSHGLHHSSIPMNRLPANSTLLTAPAGFEASSAHNLDNYPSYEMYGSDSRPDSSHGSVGSYDERRRPMSISYTEEGRPRSTHLGLGPGHAPGYQ